jgi:hypothetical protein
MAAHINIGTCYSSLPSIWSLEESLEESWLSFCELCRLLWIVDCGTLQEQCHAWISAHLTLLSSLLWQQIENYWSFYKYCQQWRHDETARLETPYHECAEHWSKDFKAGRLAVTHFWCTLLISIYLLDCFTPFWAFYAIEHRGIMES